MSDDIFSIRNRKSLTEVEGRGAHLEEIFFSDCQSHRLVHNPFVLCPIRIARVKQAWVFTSPHLL